jgi:AmmeMemoRadiSam system protein A
MSIEQGKILLPIARASIANALGKSTVADESAPWLGEPGATFVTLTQDSQLRGCIGSLEARRPLLVDVKENAIAAAFRDPRFSALTEEEFEFTQVEVSLLSPMEPISFASERDALAQLRPGIDGVVFEYARYRSTFLPQVWEQLPEVTEFMAHLKYKAGLSPDFWAEEVKLSRYTVSKWKESDLETYTA